MENRHPHPPSLLLWSQKNINILDYILDKQLTKQIAPKWLVIDRVHGHHCALAGKHGDPCASSGQRYH